MGGRSHCASCGHQLVTADLVPLFSYIFLLGKCRYCKKPISSRYFFIETITGLLFALSFVFIPQPLMLARILFVVASLVVIFMIDYEHYLILDKVIFPATAILLFFNILVDIQNHTAFKESLTIRGLVSGIAIFIVFGVIYWFSQGRGLGFGDVKFSLFLGLATPAPIIAVNIFLCFFFGAIIGILLIAFKGKNMQTKVPLGVFLSLSTLVSVFWGQQLWTSYLSLIGWR